MKKKVIFTATILLIFVFSLISYDHYMNRPPYMSYPSFLKAVENKQVSHAVLSDTADTFQITLNNPSNPKYTVPNPKTETFTEFLLKNNIRVKTAGDDVMTQMSRAVVLILVGTAVYFILRKNNDNKPVMEDVSKSSKSDIIDFNHIAGNVEAKVMVKDIIEFIKNPERYSRVGARMPKGLLLYGPPGTGKTLMAKAVAGEAGVPFYAMSGSDFVQMYVGVGAGRIRSLFKKARKNDKAVIFIDEIDAIGKKRGRTMSPSNDERDQTLNALLTEMSGFHKNNGIIVIGATNRLDTLDEALLRPGRFDRQIEIGLPDINARKKILSYYGSLKPLHEDVDLDAVAKSTVCFSGAMLENLLNEAAIHAANAGCHTICNEHMDDAFYTIIAGAPKQDRSYITGMDRNITACHEAGHALATALLLPDYYISKVTIIPSVSGAGGFNLSIPNDTCYQSKEQLKYRIQMLLAGRAAEELIFGEDKISTGSSDDIRKASQATYDYLNKYGMDSEFGLFNTEILEKKDDAFLFDRSREFLNELYGETKQLLEANSDYLDEIAFSLLENETIDGEVIKSICKLAS